MRENPCGTSGLAVRGNGNCFVLSSTGCRGSGDCEFWAEAARTKLNARIRLVQLQILRNIMWTQRAANCVMAVLLKLESFRGSRKYFALRNFEISFTQMWSALARKQSV